MGRSLSPEESLALHEEIREHNRRQRIQLMAAALEKARQSGKEPFDLARLETMCDTSSEGRLAPEAERQARLEYMYYVSHPRILTLEDLAAKIEELNKW